MTTRTSPIRLACGIAALAVIVSAVQAQAEAAPPKIDAADIAWMISATGLVLMMTIPGLALFYCGMVRKKCVLATMAQSLLCTFLCSILWALSQVPDDVEPCAGGAVERSAERADDECIAALARAHARPALRDVPEDLREPEVEHLAHRRVRCGVHEPGAELLHEVAGRQCRQPQGRPEQARCA